MVVTGFELLGAINGAAGALKLASSLIYGLAQAIQDWSEAGTKVKDLAEDLDVFTSRLDAWRVKWAISDDVGDSLCQKYWGEQNWVRIERQVAHIEETIQDFTSVLSNLTSDETLHALAPETRTKALRQRQRQVAHWVDTTSLFERTESRARKGRVAGRRDQNDCAKKAISVRQKVIFLLLESERLEDYLADLTQRLGQLKESADEFFDAQHPDVARSAYIKEQRKKAADSSAVQWCFKTQTASQILFEACLGTASIRASTAIGDTDTSLAYLEMDLVLCNSSTRGDQVGGESDPRLQYHLVLQSRVTGITCEVIVEGPHDPSSTSPQPEGLQSDFRKACESLCSGIPGNFHGHLHADVELGTMFRITHPEVPLPLDGGNKIHLFKLLRRIQWMRSIQAYEQFPRAERIRLAFKVVECGLYLLGTSWLTDLDSRKIRRLRRPNSDSVRRFIFQAGEDSPDLMQSVEPQTFKIGVLLAEVAIGQPVESVVPHHGEFGDVLDFEMAHLRDGKTHKQILLAEDVLGRVEENTSVGYKNAVAFCLQQTPKTKRMGWDSSKVSNSWADRLKAYRSVIEGYYAEVYVPLQSLDAGLAAK